jgi:hypothetical protein
VEGWVMLNAKTHYEQVPLTEVLKWSERDTPEIAAEQAVESQTEKLEAPVLENVIPAK